MKRPLLRFLLLALLPFLVATAVLAQPDSLRTYTKERPLKFEGEWDLWPYSFLNDNGEPDGYTIDLIKLLMGELDIPYTITLKPSLDAYKDLKAGRADLMMGLAVGFHDAFGLYSQNAVTLFTQSVVTPKGKDVAVKNFNDLSRCQVIVKDSSLCHHLMIDYGYEANAQPTDDIREAIQKVSAREEGQIVWNTLSLKWLMHRYHIENLELTPVNMMHGEYKFISNDQHLLDLLDETYSRLYTADKLTPLQIKWFYPERQEKQLPQWVWYVLGGALVLALILGVYIASYRLQSRRLMLANNKTNRRLALIMQTSHVRIWTYDIKTNQFTWRNENGQAAYTYSMEEFAQRYNESDFLRLKGALEQLATYQKEPGAEEREVTLQLRAHDKEEGEQELRDFVIVLSVLDRDRDGKAAVIIGTKKDVTDERRLMRMEEERTMRYWALFNTPLLGIMLFGPDGKIMNINPKACEMFGCKANEIIQAGMQLSDLLDVGHLPLKDTDGFWATQIVDMEKVPANNRRLFSIRRRGKLINEFRLMTVCDETDELVGVFAVCRDVTTTVISMDQETGAQQMKEAVGGVLADYASNIDRILRNSDVRVVSYKPDSHTLTIYSATNVVQHALTQTRCMTLVDDRSKKQAMRLLNDMDEAVVKDIDADLWTTLRNRERHQLALHFRLTPVVDKHGNVTEYLGLCRDMSELRHIEQLMAVEEGKLQEVENTKTSFINNMVQEIRHPMNTVVSYVEQLDPDKPVPNEDELSKGILENAEYLLHLIDNVLYLSRLEARMVDIKKQSQNFADIFASQCMAGWMKYKNSDTRYVVENPYEQLVVDIDADNVVRAIAQVTANAAQHTKNGVVRARYDYIGRRLIISIDDTGEGIPKAELERLNQMGTGSARTTKGLGLTITKELVEQMGGMVDISSEEGSGTTVYITIPCHASVIKRKKMI